MNKITGLGNTKSSVAYAFHIGNNAILDEFTDYVKASTFNTDVPSVCAFESTESLKRMQTGNSVLFFLPFQRQHHEPLTLTILGPVAEFI
jgi:hypothetical protein